LRYLFLIDFLIDFDPPRCVQLAVGLRARPGPADTR